MSPDVLARIWISALQRDGKEVVMLEAKEPQEQLDLLILGLLLKPFPDRWRTRGVYICLNLLCRFCHDDCVN